MRKQIFNFRKYYLSIFATERKEGRPQRGYWNKKRRRNNMHTVLGYIIRRTDFFNRFILSDQLFLFLHIWGGIFSFVFQIKNVICWLVVHFTQCCNIKFKYFNNKKIK